MKFKVGDRIRSLCNGSGTLPDGEWTINKISSLGQYFGVEGNPTDTADPVPFDFKNYQLELISSTNQTTMDIKEKFQLAFKSEPEKSFRKAGVTNGDDYLTDDGQKIFLSWLLKKNGADFKTEVVDDLLKDDKAA